ncbi:hypothetical protein GMMP1_1000002 [Candidatus Magnetomoraceae bacterium gMMP-1]
MFSGIKNIYYLVFIINPPPPPPRIFTNYNKISSELFAAETCIKDSYAAK